jgi:hypothetical protein
MSSALRNSITASMGRSGLGDVGAKSTIDLAGCPSASFFRYRGARSPEVGAKSGMAATPSPSPAAGGGDEEDVGAGDGDERRRGEPRLQRPSLASRRRARATG